MDLDELEEKITERIKPYWEDAKRVTRLIGNGYLLSELNAIWKIDFRQYSYLNGISSHRSILATALFRGSFP